MAINLTSGYEIQVKDILEKLKEYLPLNGGTINGNIIVGGDFTVDSKTVLNDTLRIASSTTITKGGLTIKAPDDTGCITTPLITATYLQGNNGRSVINLTAAGGSYVSIVNYPSTNGVFKLSGYQQGLYAEYTDNATIAKGTNTFLKRVMLLDETGNSSFPGEMTIASGTTIVAGGLYINNGGLYANGGSTFDGGATVSTGGLTVNNGGLTVDAGGMNVTGNSVVSGTLTCTNALTTSSLAVTGDASVGNSLKVNQAVTANAVNANNIVASKSIVDNGTLTVAGATTLNGGATIAGNTTINGTVTATKFNGAINDNATATTQPTTDNSTKVATTAFVKNALGAYLPLKGGTLTGTLNGTIANFTGLVTGQRLSAVNGVNTNVDIWDSSSENGGGGWYLNPPSHPNAGWSRIITDYGNSSINGTFSATRVYNAVFNDYAEFYPRGEETEVGDLIALDVNSDTEVYVKATCDNDRICGVHSDTFGHLIGGEQPPEENIDFVEYNLKKYIPVGIKGRCKTKVVGKVKKGDYLVVSNIPGVARVFDKKTNSKFDIIGYACESSDVKETKLIKINLYK